MMVDWHQICTALTEASTSSGWCFGQERTLRVLAQRLVDQPGMVIADDVGLGKTRVALAVVNAVIAHGGTAAVLAPPGLLYQWKQEWRTIAPSGPPPLLLRSFDQLIRSPDRQWPRLQPYANVSPPHPWAVISHRFGIPMLRKDSSPERYGVIALAAAFHREQGAPRGFKNGLLWQFATRLTGRCRTESCGDLDCYPCKLVAAARFLSAHAHGVLHNIDETQIVAPDQAKPYFTEEWRQQFLEIMRAMIGAVDLLVIDEAHKSRDEEQDESVLGELIRHITPARGRCLALTATPIELGVDQWSVILKRIGVKTTPRDQVQSFADALRMAQRHPDRADVIEKLVTQAGVFTDALRPHVTRRRRIEQPAMREIVGDCPGAHPHRSIEVLRIPIGSIDPVWRRVVLAIEGLGKAAKGSGLSGVLRTADVRYAAGHIGQAVYEDDSDLVDGRDVESSHDLTGKRTRIRYWKRIAKSQLQADDAGLLAHPRVLSVARRIDDLLHGVDLDGKILVFGVYTKPLRALVGALNRRAILRLIDRHHPFPMADPESESELIWSEYQLVISGQSETHPNACGYRDRLAGPLRSKEHLVRLLRESAIRYRRLRAALSRTLHVAFLDSALSTDAPHCRGEIDAETLVELLRSRVLHQHMNLDSSAIDHDLVRVKARDILSSEFLKPCTDRESDGQAISTHYGEDDASEHDGVTNARKLANLIESESADGLTRFGSFARLLIGDTRVESRRGLQAQFNRRAAYPRVLVAQSRVGREGLNLQHACSRVILFNAEWNPGVIEQQIGRVDRIQSLWEEQARAWHNDGCKGPMPMIQVEQVLFEGTYDEYQWDIVHERQRSLGAQLHGELLDDDTMTRVPDDLRTSVFRAAPTFEP